MAQKWIRNTFCVVQNLFQVFTRNKRFEQSLLGGKKQNGLKDSNSRALENNNTFSKNII